MKKQSTLREMSEAEAAWIGAFIDAEGSIYQRKDNNWYVVVHNTELEHISALLRVTGLGKVYTQKLVSPLSKIPLWQWWVLPQLDVLKLCQKIAPYCLKAQRVCATVKYRAGENGD